ncbi:MAG: TIGR00730 family Rossman fold protein [Bauldia sp.]|nr:TIGR00730 family Rossman fold protein [Bauldia sp.]
MALLTSVCVYCGASRGRDPIYATAAEAFGRLLAEAGVRLVYGGGSVGLMGIVARSVLAHGGGVSGIIPQFLKDREIMLDAVPDLTVTVDMHERKRLMFEKADAFVALPGGIGTLEETVEMMTWAQLGRHAKPVLLVNINGFWEPLVQLLGHMDAEGFLHKDFLPDTREPYLTCEGVQEVIPTLERALASVPEAELDQPSPTLL